LISETKRHGREGIPLRQFPSTEAPREPLHECRDSGRSPGSDNEINLRGVDAGVIERSSDLVVDPVQIPLDERIKLGTPDGYRERNSRAAERNVGLKGIGKLNLCGLDRAKEVIAMTAIDDLFSRGERLTSRLTDELERLAHAIVANHRNDLMERSHMPQLNGNV
jgi:hypothetical protein